MSTLPKALSEQDADFQQSNASRRQRMSVWFYGLCVAIALISVVVLVVLLVSIWVQGQSRLTADLLMNSHSELDIERSGMWPAIIGSLFVCGVCALVALPLGVGTAVFLEEFKPKAKPLRWLHGFVQLNIANLAGVPSIVYGLLGLTVFVYMFNIFGQIKVNESSGWELMGANHKYQVLSLETGNVVFVPQTDPDQRQITIDQPVQGMDAAGDPIEIEVWQPGTPKPTDPAVRRRTVRSGAIGATVTEKSWYYFRLPLDKSFLAGGLTLALVILPIIIIASQESLRGVSPSLREASMGLGATTWQTVRDVSLPAALPGIMTGSILAMGRAIGEAAPILVVLGAAVAKNAGPQNLMDNAVTMPVLIYNWAGRQQDEFKELAAAAIIVLLVILLLLNSAAIIIRHKVQQSQS
ncbi:ABC transporter permease subunit [Roseiconus nitratireducens]|uniref:ABC transporter permease subunit n=1 Tax=Roseiconus nitratireducens TaxID=2605748 RepID=A0A5M6D496_9BACT|nr:ABC transporter permease subunit [Roseiconus nitratireducens]KAA5541410.1 ABC transporter permease subunit [Roseiconus nitratireducens]